MERGRSRKSTLVRRNGRRKSRKTKGNCALNKEWSCLAGSKPIFLSIHPPYFKLL